MIRALCLALLSASPALADICARSVALDEPVAGITVQNPDDLIRDVRLIPGYPNLIIAQPFWNLLFTIRDYTYVHLDVPFPKPLYYASYFVDELSDGQVIGRDGQARVLYRLDTGSGKFTEIAGTEGYVNAQLDPITGVFRFVLPDETLFDLMPEGPVPTDMIPYVGIADHDAILPRYIPGLNAHLASTDYRLMILPDGADRWSTIPLPDGIIDHLHRLNTAEVIVDTEQSIAVIMLKHRAIVLDLLAETPLVHYVADSLGRRIHADGHVLLEQRRFDGGRFGTGEELPPRLRLVTRDGLQPVPGAPEIVLDPADPSAFTFLRLNAQGQSMVRLADRWWVFEHGGLYPAPEPFQLPEAVWPLGPQEANLWRNEGRVWHVDAELRSTELPLPISTDWAHITHSAAFEGYFLVTEAGVWFSSDMRAYDALSLPDDMMLKKVVSDLPGEKAVLALGADSLYVLRDCSPEEEAEP